MSSELRDVTLSAPCLASGSCSLNTGGSSGSTHSSDFPSTGSFSFCFIRLQCLVPSLQVWFLLTLWRLKPQCLFFLKSCSDPRVTGGTNPVRAGASGSSATWLNSQLPPGETLLQCLKLLSLLYPLGGLGTCLLSLTRQGVCYGPSESLNYACCYNK